ncbi:glutathione S-transferase [Amylocarpus encephaloides]|uniref:Glutathione S-transferase n=1 Tax=Amylocarpus encephaloides TaxID=45428 RepID=A0A9P7YMG5_9HELO|nr:glutathione S-transferase [Amylocarpus encephaloides]
MASPADSRKDEVAKAGLPILYHLDTSNSQRILWLLEELGIQYELRASTRQRQRAPAALTKVHQLGKAPMLTTADGRTIIESPVIVSYLLTTYDTNGLFTSTDPIRTEELSSFATASLGPVTATEMLVEILVEQTPWPISYLTKAIRGRVRAEYTSKEFEKALGYLETELGENEWFGGERLGKEDFMLSFPLDVMVGRGWVHLEGRYPRLEAWRRRVGEREAWRRGLKRGNGYDVMGLGRT